VGLDGPVDRGGGCDRTGVSATGGKRFPQQAENAEGNAPVTTSRSSQTVDEILEQQEALLTGQRFSYDPAGRRDPFRNLMEVDPGKKGDCREGISCMVIAEIDLGDSVFDGTITGIDPRLGVVTFRQEVDDPRRIKPYRDVKKSLVTLDNEESIR